MEKTKIKKEKSYNQVIRVKFLKRDKKYECVGILAGENEKTVTVVFNAIDKVIKDDITLLRKNILSIKKINKKDIDVVK